jgi:1-phosphatidylinositol-3-phosphate 5-kinase
MIRVCNLCLEKLANVDDDDDDDDRRSVVSFATSLPGHQFGMDSLSLGHHPQSPFAASQLFGRTDEPFNLFSIAETKHQISGSDESGFGSRPITPGLQEGDVGQWEAVRQNPAPFRRGLYAEDKEPVDISDPYSHHGSPTGPRSKTPAEMSSPATLIGGGAMSSIQFPVGSPDHGWDSPGPGSRGRSRFNSFGDFDVATPFIRSRVQSRLDNVAEPGWRTRRESTA